jgi:hypothetical protein
MQFLDYAKNNLIHFEHNNNANVIRTSNARQVLITWHMVVNRLVDFVRAHNFDSDESNAIRAHTVFRTYLLRARYNCNTRVVCFCLAMDEQIILKCLSFLVNSLTCSLCTHTSHFYT